MRARKSLSITRGHSADRGHLGLIPGSLASPELLARLARAVNPKILLPIHGEA